MSPIHISQVWLTANGECVGLLLASLFGRIEAQPSGSGPGGGRTPLTLTLALTSAMELPAATTSSDVVMCTGFV